MDQGMRLELAAQAGRLKAAIEILDAVNSKKDRPNQSQCQGCHSPGSQDNGERGRRYGGHPGRHNPPPFPMKR